MRFARGGPPAWTERRKDEVARLVALYPEGRSAIMPLLHLAQEERGFITQGDLEAIAGVLGMPMSAVESVASFYAMYHGERTGRFVVTVCTSLPCHMAHADRVVEAFKKALGIEEGETTPDGLITLEATSECLAACDAGPVVQVNREYFLRLNPVKVRDLVTALRQDDGEALARLAEYPSTGEALFAARVREVGGRV
ncbi:MAG: NADH-quinone oxidoreductase subunit NuoE [Bacillota bacterium]